MGLGFLLHLNFQSRVGAGKGQLITQRLWQAEDRSKEKVRLSFSL